MQLLNIIYTKTTHTVNTSAKTKTGDPLTASFSFVFTTVADNGTAVDYNGVAADLPV